MLETYFDQKFHFSSEIQMIEVEKVWIFLNFQVNPLCNLYRCNIGDFGEITTYSTSITCISELKWDFWVKDVSNMFGYVSTCRKLSLKEIGAVYMRYIYENPKTIATLLHVLKLPSSSIQTSLSIYTYIYAQ